MITVTGARELRNLIQKFVRSYGNQPGAKNWWRDPLLATARIDERFDVLPNIASDDHLLPTDLLPGARSLIVFFIPFTKELIEENTIGPFPCRNWGLAYEATNELIGLICERIKNVLAVQGYMSAITPATHNFDEIKLMAKWSHKHLAHLSGLGRIGMNAQLITPAGCAGRLGSLVTEADLGDAPLVTEDELCLHKRGEECLECFDRCPIQALGEEGIDRQKCWERLKYNLENTEQLVGLQDSTHVCGKCVVGLPCSYSTCISEIFRHSLSSRKRSQHGAP